MITHINIAEHERRYRSCAWSKESCIQAIRDFYERKKRVPGFDDMNSDNGLPSIGTLRRHVHINSLTGVIELALGTVPIANIVEKFVCEKSESGQKRIFYMTTHDINRMYGTDIRKLGAYMRKVTMQKRIVAGYNIRAITTSRGKRRTFECTRVDPPDIFKYSNEVIQ